jgi:hypothetical protein
MMFGHECHVDASVREAIALVKVEEVQSVVWNLYTTWVRARTNFEVIVPISRS